MTTEQRIEIALSKKKIAMMLVAALVFIAVGLWFVIAPPEVRNSFWGDATRLAILGYAAIFFGVLGTVFFLAKLRDTKPGLIIEDSGFTDNSSAISAGHVSWADVTDISVLQMHQQKLIMVELRNPEEYIERQGSLIKRKLMNLNYNSYGTPISITVNGLKISFEELLSLLTEKVNKARTTTPA